MTRIMKTSTFYLLFLALSLQLTTANTYDCAAKNSIVHESVKAKNFKEAIPVWREMLAECPDYHYAIYVNGDKIMDYLIENAKDASEKEKYIREKVSLYGQYYKYFPDRIKDYKSKQALTLFDSGIGSKEEIEALLKDAFTNDKANFTNGKAMYVLFEYLVNDFKANKPGITLPDVFLMNDQIAELLEVENNKLSEDLDVIVKKEDAGEELSSKEARDKVRLTNNIDSYALIASSMEGLIAELSNCDRLIPLLEKDFDANKDNLDWIKRTANRLSNKGCTDSPFFSKLLDQYEKLTPPTFGTLYNKGISLIKSDKTKAKEYFMKALDMAPDNNKKADLYFTIATQIYGMGNKATAKSYCDKALGLKPSLDKAHMYIAQLYAASLNDVGLTDAFDKRAIYWLAAQTARKGGTAAANSLAAKYEAAAPNKQEIFQSGKAGQQICFKGWIGKCITVPNL